MDLKFEQLCPNVFQDQILESELWNSSVQIRPAEQVMLHAPSGRGKTSFIYYLTGLRNDYSGAIFIDDKDIRTLTMSQWIDLRRTKLSVVYQDLQLFDQLTVKDNISMLPQFAQGYELESAHELLIDLGIGEKWDSKTGVLSFGQKQRLALVRSLMKPFDLLICDEPFSHLDVVNTSKCIDLIQRRVKEENAGVIISCLDDIKPFDRINTIHL
jgi:putative ABC transport system ATP-binding protein